MGCLYAICGTKPRAPVGPSDKRIDLQADLDVLSVISTTEPLNEIRLVTGYISQQSKRKLILPVIIE